MASESKKVKRGMGSMRAKAGQPAKAGKRRTKNLIASISKMYGDRSYESVSKPIENHVETTDLQRSRGRFLSTLWKMRVDPPYTPVQTREQFLAGIQPEPVNVATRAEFMAPRSIHWMTEDEQKQLTRVDKLAYR